MDECCSAIDNKNNSNKQQRQQQQTKAPGWRCTIRDPGAFVFKSPTECRRRVVRLHPSISVVHVNYSASRIDVPSRHPCIISSLPWRLEVIKMTSAPKLCQVSLRSLTLSGRPPRFLESQRIMRSGSMYFVMRPVMVGPNVFSWSDPIQIRNQLGLWMQVERAAPMPVPVQMRIPRLNMAEA